MLIFFKTQVAVDVTGSGTSKRVTSLPENTWDLPHGNGFTTPVGVLPDPDQNASTAYSNTLFSSARLETAQKTAMMATVAKNQNQNKQSAGSETDSETGGTLAKPTSLEEGLY